MTLKTLASISLALILSAIVSTAEARTRHQTESLPAFDRHAVVTTGNEAIITERSARKVKTAGLKQIRKKYQKRYREKPRAPHDQAARHLMVASTGAKTSVSTVARPHFQCLLTKLEAVGYRIDFMGGYAHRGNSSAHPTGNALDINQTSRNRVTRPLPANATEMARECGLVHGAVWSNPDKGHFEMPRKYGYIFHHRRTRYASAR